jgi:YVTN family beta-propeller protein
MLALTHILGSTVAAATSVIKEGVRIEFALESPGGKKDVPVVAGKAAVARFKLTDSATGTPISGISPAAWMDLLKKGAENLSCKDKIQSFLQGSLAYRPEVNFNTWYLLSLNEQPSITVIDPLFGYGGQQTLAMPLLTSPGEDWVIGPDRKKVFISLPRINRIAVLDSGDWKVTGHIDVASRPTRLALQPDRKLLWITHDSSDAQSGVSVIDASSHVVLAHLQTGMGEHRIAFDKHSRFALVTNAGDGTVSVIDIAKRKEARRVKVGGRPVSADYSVLGDAFYVANEDSGAVTILDGATLESRGTVSLDPGLRTIRFAPGGRWGFIANFRSNQVSVLDASNNRILSSVPVGAQPYQITFTPTLAYVRSAGDRQISTIPLTELNNHQKASVTSIIAGDKPPSLGEALETAYAIFPTPQNNGALIGNPADQAIYYYMEGMLAPQGSFSLKGLKTRGVLALHRGLEETSPGVYSSLVTPPSAGTYDVAFLMSSPRAWHCFTAKVAAGAASSDQPAQRYRLHYREQTVAAGRPATIHFGLVDANTGQPVRGVKDIRVLLVATARGWQQRASAKESGVGEYAVTLTPPSPGNYLLLLESRSLKIKMRDLPVATLRVSLDGNIPQPAPAAK